MTETLVQKAVELLSAIDENAARENRDACDRTFTWALEVYQSARESYDALTQIQRSMMSIGLSGLYNHLEAAAEILDRHRDLEMLEGCE